MSNSTPVNYIFSFSYHFYSRGHTQICTSWQDHYNVHHKYDTNPTLRLLVPCKQKLNISWSLDNMLCIIFLWSCIVQHTFCTQFSSTGLVFRRWSIISVAPQGRCIWKTDMTSRLQGEKAVVRDRKTNLKLFRRECMLRTFGRLALLSTLGFFIIFFFIVQYMRCTL